jgi:hypothetical protein
MKQEKQIIKDSESEMALIAFPKSLNKDLHELISRISVHTLHPTQWTFPVELDNQPISIPVRIYWEEHRLMEPRDLNETQRTALSCLLTRHHNGFVREKHLKLIMGSKHYWVQPFIIQLIGEYVVEIIQHIQNNFSDLNKMNLTKFINENPEFWDLTKNRIISYWDCYYRKKFNGQITGFTRQEYPGFRLVDRVENEIKTKAQQGV